MDLSTTEGARCRSNQYRRRARDHPPPFGSAAVMLVAVARSAVAGAAGLAFTKTPNPMLHGARSSMVGKTIVVDSHGSRWYELSQETPTICSAPGRKATLRPGRRWRSAPPRQADRHCSHGKAGPPGTPTGSSSSPPPNTRDSTHRRRFPPRQRERTGLQTFGGRWHVVTASHTTPPPPMTTTHHDNFVSGY